MKVHANRFGTDIAVLWLHLITHNDLSRSF
jgi:hypothetical protein